MKPFTRYSLAAAVALALPGVAAASVNIQCPGDMNDDAIPDTPVYKTPGDPSSGERQIRCMHVNAGDGFITMADGYPQYMFGFSDVTGLPADQVLDVGILAAEFPAPDIVLEEGDEFYLTLTNVGLVMRPDLFDPHTVHFHGYPNASMIYDGVPDASISINQGSSLTYYYNMYQPGTFMWHCHVEATEHMQMGMLGQLWVHPKQNGTPHSYAGRTFTKFAYNDGDGSTGYDVEYGLQLGSFDPDFHDASLTVQPLPFANMRDTYPMINGRGYPDTIIPGSLGVNPESGAESQKIDSLITAQQGDRILLRMTNLNVTNYYTVGTSGLPMEVVAQGARLLRGPTGNNLYYKTASVTVGGGEAYDVIIDTQGVAPGTYHLYTTNLYFLSNREEDFGGMMTEIVITP